MCLYNPPGNRLSPLLFFSRLKAMFSTLTQWYTQNDVCLMNFSSPPSSHPLLTLLLMKSFIPVPLLSIILFPPHLFGSARRISLFCHLTALWFQSYPVCNKLFAFNLACPIFQTPSWLICLSHTRRKLPRVILIFRCKINMSTPRSAKTWSIDFVTVWTNILRQSSNKIVCFWLHIVMRQDEDLLCVTEDKNRDRSSALFFFLSFFPLR